MKRSQPRRDWSDANLKRGPCLVCGRTDGVELAHLTERASDFFYAMDEAVVQRPVSLTIVTRDG